MAKCYACGNEYDKTFTVTTHNNKTYTFDAMECAIKVVAPRCAHCGVMIIGHGREQGDTFYCCEHCMEAATA